MQSLSRVTNYLVKSLLFLSLFFAQAWATTSTLTGIIRDAQGNGINGTLVAALPLPAQDSSTNVQIAPGPVMFRLVNGAISGGAPLYDTATMTPQGLYYVMRAYNATGTPVWGGNIVVTGTNFDLGTAIPTTITTSNISYAAPQGSLSANNVWGGSNTFNGSTVFNNSVTFNSGFRLPVTLTNPGVFTNTQMNEYLSSSIGTNCSTHTEITSNPFFGGNNATDAVAGCVHAPASASAFSWGLLGIGITDGSTSTTSGGVFTAHANGNDSLGIGAQAIAWDTANGGFTNMELLGLNVGVAAANGAAAYEILDGIEVTALFSSQPNGSWSGNASQLITNGVHIQGGPTNKWQRGFLSDPGAALVGAHYDGTCALGGGNNCASQGIEMAGVNAGNRGNAAAFFADQNGNLFASTQSGGVFSINANVRAFSTLPTCVAGLEGSVAPINDSTVTTWGATITGGGGNHVLAYCDGATWTVATKATSNCAINSASPGACGSATSGVFVAGTVTSYTVNTTAVTANSRIFVQQITDNTGIPSSPTCFASADAPFQSARVAGTSFTITLASQTTPCYEYFIIN